MSDRDKPRDLTEAVFHAFVMDEWPSRAGQIDFGLATPQHYAALQWAVKFDGVTVEQLDAALGKGEALQALISSKNPHRDVKFETQWEHLVEEPDWDQEKDWEMGF